MELFTAIGLIVVIFSASMFFTLVVWVLLFDKTLLDNSFSVSCIVTILILSFVLSCLILKPESFGYTKVVSENVAREVIE